MQLTIAELLDYVDEERTRWQQWFSDHGEAPLAFPLPGKGIPTVGALIQHALGAPLWFAEQLKGRPVTEWWKSPPSSAAELFSFGEHASTELRDFVSTAKPEDWNASIIVDVARKGEHHVTARKAVANSLVHAIRHWAQVALVVRQNGMTPPGEHDLIFSRALQ